jgi:hypothetical protein
VIKFEIVFACALAGVDGMAPLCAAAAVGSKMCDERFEDLLERLGTNTRLDTVCLGPF